ncbi:MAG: hypothetical protein SO003_04345 [Candidatus Borkfalkiaceae bacterium]|nr:hypothetical protein [Christensenellaceae bacterium]
MKKLLSLFIALVMSFTLVFGTVACNKNNGDASTGTTESSDTGSGSTTESNSGSQSGEETAKEIKVDYVHAKFTATLKSPSATDVAAETALEDIKGDVYVKFIGTEVEFAVNADAFVTNLSDATGTEKANVKLDVRYVGGVLYGRLTGSAFANGQDENGEAIIEKNELDECDVSYVGTLEEVFAYLTAMSEKVDESASVSQQLVMSQIPAIIDAVKQTIAARGKIGQLGLKSYPQITFDVKTQIIDKVLAFVEENAEVDLLTIIAKLTGEKDSTVLEERLKKIFDESKGEATVADVVDRLVAFVNSYTAMPVDLKAMCDGIQAEAGLTTVDAVAFVKELLKSQAGMTDEQINTVLPAVTDGQTIYDYVYAIAKNYKVNDIIKMFTASKPEEPSPDVPSPDVPDAQAAEGDAQPDAQPDAGESITFGQIGEQAIGFLKGTTLSQAFGMVAGDLTLAKWLEMAKGVVQKLELTSEFAVNANGYPTKIANSVAYRINLKNVSGDGTTDVIVAGTAAAAFDIDYAETVPADKASMFVIPAEGSYPAYLKLTQFGLTKAQTEKALKEGLKVEIVPANGEYAEWEISVKTSDAAFVSKDNTITYNGKKVVYVENGTLVFDAEFFKAVETEKRTVEVAFGMKSAKGGDKNVIYSFSPITDTAEHA